MTTVNEIQLILQNCLKRTVSQTEIGKAIGTGRSNINLRIKNNSEIKKEEIKKLEEYFKLKIPENSSKNTLIYKEIVQILDSATSNELDFYYDIIKQCKKNIEIIKNKN